MQVFFDFIMYEGGKNPNFKWLMNENDAPQKISG